MVKKQNEVVKGVDHVSRGGRRGRFHKGFKPESNKRCTNCNLLLDYRHTECPAKDEICNNCGKKGHYVRFCRADSSSRNSTRGSGRGSGRSRGRGNYRGRGDYHRNLDEVSEEYVATDTDDMYIFLVLSFVKVQLTKTPVTITVEIVIVPSSVPLIVMYQTKPNGIST